MPRTGVTFEPALLRTHERVAQPIARISTSPAAKRTPANLSSARLAGVHSRSPRHSHSPRAHTGQYRHAVYVPLADQRPRRHRIDNSPYASSSNPAIEAYGSGLLVPDYLSGDRPPRLPPRQRGKCCHPTPLSPARQSILPHLFPSAHAHHFAAGPPS